MKGMLGKVTGGRVLEEKRTTAAELAEHIRAQARRLGWAEYSAAELEERGRWLVDPRGRLYKPARGAVALSDGTLADSAAADAFYVSPGGEAVTFLVRSWNPATVAELEERAAEREQAAAAREARVREFVAAQPLRVLTAADLAGHRKPQTLREAARLLEDAGCRVGRGEHGELEIKLPERLAPPGERGVASRDALLAAARTLLAGERAVLAELERRSTRPLAERLPDGLPSAGGGVVAVG
jgi:hypothetical protein